MAEIFYRAKYTAPIPSTITDGFTITLSTGYTEAPNNTRGYFIIVDSTDVFANVIGTITAGNNLKVNRVEYDSTRSDGVPLLTDALPTFIGGVTILSSLPLVEYGEELTAGMDGILILGDDSSVGHNGSTVTNITEGYHPVLDTLDSNVLMYRPGKVTVNSDHTAYESDIDELEETITVASDPLPSNGTTSVSNLLGPANSVGFGITLAKEYYHRLPGARQTCLLSMGALGRTVASVDSSQENGTLLHQTFQGLSDGNKVSVLVLSFGVADAIAGTSGSLFESRIDSIIASQRLLNTSLPVIICAMPDAVVTSTNGSDINTVILNMPNRHEGLSVAIPDVYTLDTLNRYVDALGQRAFGKVIFNALETALDNQTL